MDSQDRRRIAQPSPSREDDERTAGTQILYRYVASPWIGAGMVALAAAALFAFGVVGMGRGDRVMGVAMTLRPDTRVLYVAGRMWLEGRNPYLVGDFLATSDRTFQFDHAFMASGFGYLPTAWPLCVLLGLFDAGSVFAVMLVLNVAAVGIAALYGVRLSSYALEDGPLRRSLRFFIPAMVVGGPFTTHVVFQGQSTMLATAALAAGWYYTFAKPRSNLAGLLLALATTKVQIALFAVAGLAMHRKWRVLVPMAVACVLVVAHPVVVAGGPVALARDWLAEVHAYSAIPGNALGHPTVFGLQSLLVAGGVRVPGFALLALPLLAVLWRFRSGFTPEALLAILVATSCLFVYAHDYDLAALVTLHGCMWKRVGRDGKAALAVAAFYALLFLPRHALGSPPPVFLHWREIVLLAGMSWLVSDAIRRPATA